MIGVDPQRNGEGFRRSATHWESKLKFDMYATILLTVLLAAPAIACPPQLRVQRDRLFVSVEINGNETEALLDSGAEMTLIDAGFARRIGLVIAGSEIARGTGGTEEVSFAQGVDIDAIGVSLKDRTVAVFDLADISERLLGEQVDAIVGRELFDAGRFFLNVEKKQFCITEEQTESQGVRLTLVEHKGIMQVPVAIENLEPVWADFDLGNGSEVLIGRHYALQNDLLNSSRVVGTKEGGGIGGAVSRELIELETVTLADVSFPGVIAAVDSSDDAPDVNIGVSILRNFAMTIDFPSHEVWLTPVESVR